MVSIPQQPEDLSAPWLSQVLGRNITAVDRESIAAGVGFLGKLTRLRLTSDDGGPRSVIAKLPTLDPGVRQLVKLFRFYEREVRFYQDLSARIAMRVPRAHHCAIDPASGDFVLLLEDMAPAQIGDQLESCTIEQARLAVQSIAALHAGWWRRPELDALDWMPCANDPVNLSAEPTYQQCWPGFMAFVGDKLPGPVKRTGEALATRINKIQHAMMQRPPTIVHGDFRLDNLFFASPRGGVPFAAVDWQIAFRGNGTFDVGYLVAGNLTPAARRAGERELLRLYHEALLSGGVRDYSLADCQLDYRLAVLFCLIYVVISIATLDPSNARGLALFQAWLERIGAAMIDLEVDQVMPA